jgi:hypothetical protein
MITLFVTFVINGFAIYFVFENTKILIYPFIVSYIHSIIYQFIILPLNDDYNIIFVNLHALIKIFSVYNNYGIPLLIIIYNILIYDNFFNTYLYILIITQFLFLVLFNFFTIFILYILYML